MASFKKVQAEYVDVKYETRILVILESEEDVRIFKDHWFAHYLEKMRFKSAEDGNFGGGGCKVVISKVEEANNQDIKAYGIIDRDVLLSDEKLDLFWEPDDKKFQEAQPYGEHIYVLRRWELENYLLQPGAFAEEVSRRVSRSPAPTLSHETFLEQAEDIVQVTALTTFLVTNKKNSPNPGFGSQVSGDALINDITKHLNKQFPGKTHTDICNDIDKIRAFDQNETSSILKWEKLSRILDGKKSLIRLCRYLSESLKIESIRPWEEMRGCLANVIASQESIDSELLELIERIAKG